MKATGVVRRIDDLGRIVIPKEIRKTLKIRDGELLEIFVEEENIILKKYSSFSDIKNVCDRIVSAVNLFEKTIVIIDNEKVISSNDISFLDKRLSNYCLNLLERRELKIDNNEEMVELFDLEDYKQNYLISPLIYDSDVIGGIIIFSKNTLINDFDKEIALFVNKFLIKNVE